MVGDGLKLIRRLNDSINVGRYQVTATPTTLLFYPDGEEKHRFDGFQTAADYLQELMKDG